jgi:signal peptidase I
MADALLGDHYVLACRDCRFPIRYDAESPPSDERVVCPNCGCVNEHGDSRSCRGQRVLLDRAAYALRGPRRWDTVAARTPGEPQRLTVKRVVGMPGESAAIRHGDLYANGRIVQKSLAAFRQVAILVHDDWYHPRGTGPAATVPERWRVEAADSRWRRRGGRWQCLAAPDRESGGWDWLRYHHARCFASPLPPRAPGPVCDHYGHNQNESRQLHTVPDLLLICQLQATGRAGALAFQIHDGYDQYRVELRPRERHGQLYRSGTPAADFALPAAAYARGVSVEWAACDRRVLLAIDDRVVLQYDCGPPQGPLQADPAPLAIGVCGLSVTVRRLQMWRDLYYLDPLGLGRDWEAPRALRADEYFLVGDNVPVSQDSRHWPTLGMSRDALVGRVWP